MNSSTSSSKNAEWKVVAIFVTAFLLFEIVARILAPTLDYDRVHIHALPGIVEEMGDDKRPRVVLLGNSLLMHGADGELLEEEISRAISGPCSITKITPVGTAIRDWNYLYDTYFTEKNTHPDVVVVGFVAHHIPDQCELKMRRLARHFCSLGNLWDCLQQEGPTFDDRAVGALSHFSALYGDQAEHHWGASSFTVPEFGRGTRKINNILDGEARRKARKKAEPNSSPAPPPRTYQKLAHLIETFRKHGVKACFVPMPQPESWEFDPAATEVIVDNGATLIDGRAIAGMKQADFLDGYHLGETGTKRFTHFLAKALAKELSAGTALSP